MPPFFVGVINRVKSIIAGRTGPPILQLYHDIFKLIKKNAVYSRSTSCIFRIVPLTSLLIVLCAGMLLPIASPSPISFQGDVILFVYLFALARFLTITAALDTASSFEGMGASREATYGALSEITIFIVLMTLVIIVKSLSLNKMLTHGQNVFVADPSVILLFLAFFFIMLTENSRMPIDDPHTHLELTMIHEVMILDYSGPDLGIILYGASIKLFVFMAFTAMIIFPCSEGPVWAGTGILFLKVLAVSIMTGLVESFTARIKLIRIPQMLIASFVLTLFALLITLFDQRML
ncbi:MAG: NADH-quinone oxidoreductase subunit H [Deltaproteobacteria bacterium]|nr:NADH-quinone oxidoreductase subunit H [Deltaproteobacteria bacterium]